MTDSAQETPDVHPEPAPPAPRLARSHKKNPNLVASSTASSKPDIQGESTFGAIPGRAVYWSLEKETTGGQIQKMSYPNATNTAYVSEWPIVELTEENVRDRWGGGMFRVRWHGLSAAGGRVMLGQGRLVQVIGTVAPPTPAAPHAPSPGPTDDITRTLQLMSVFEDRSQKNLTGILQAASAIAAQSHSGMDPAMLQLLMQNQQQSQVMMTNMMAEMRASSDRQIAELRAVIEATVVRSARPVAPAVAAPIVQHAVGAAKEALFKAGEPAGDQLKSAFLNFAIENPQEVVNTIKSIPAILDGVAKVIQQPQPQQARPVRRTIDVEAQPAPEPPPPPMQPGLNGFSADRQRDSVPPAPVTP